MRRQLLALYKVAKERGDNAPLNEMFTFYSF